jgi:hypothetical protein
MEECVAQFSQEHRDADLIEGLSSFLAALFEAEKIIIGKPSPESFEVSRALLDSDRWSSLKLAARRLLEMPAASKFRSGRTDIAI